VVGFARVLERVIAEADVTPPVVDVTLQGFLAALQMPIRYVLKKIDNAQQRSQIQAIYDEVQATGKVIQNLPADEKAVRELYAQEVLKIPLAQLDAEVPRVTGHAALAPVAEQRPSLPRLAAETHRETPKVETLRTEKPLVKPALKIAEESTRPARVEPLASVTPATGKLKFRLNKRSEIVDAPSIGGKTAARLQAAGIKTVGDLLAADPIRVAATVGAAHIESDTIRQWQAEALLVCRVPELYGHDAQILVASGIREPQDLAALTPAALLDMVTPFVDSSEGQRILRSSKAPDLEEVTNWIAWGRQARSLKAA